MKSFNLYGDEWDETRDREGWHIKEAFVGHRIGGALIGASMSEVEPGSKLWPYHAHHANEEWVIVLRGEPTLRTLDYIDSGKVYATDLAGEPIMFSRPGPTVDYWEGED
jgi:uncharacterized cupin superfamily protein